MTRHPFATSVVVTSVLLWGGLASTQEISVEKWLYSGARSGDYFRNKGNGIWEEVVKDTKTGRTVIFHFREVGERGGGFIYLEDSARNISVKLGPYTRELRYPGSNGRWVESVSGQLPREAPAQKDWRTKTISTKKDVAKADSNLKKMDSEAPAQNAALASAGQTNEKPWKEKIDAGWELFGKKQYAQSERTFRDAIQLAEDLGFQDERLAKSYQGLAAALDLQDRLPAAEVAIVKAVAIADASKASPGARWNVVNSLMIIMERRGKFRETEAAAIQRLQITKNHFPKENLYRCYASLALLYSTWPVAQYRDGAKAVEYARKAAEIYEWKNCRALDILAAAYAENNDFPAAIAWQEKALVLSFETTQRDGFTVLSADSNTRQEFFGRLQLYRSGLPYRQTGALERPAPPILEPVPDSLPGLSAPPEE